MDQNFSYSSLADVYAVADEETEENAKKLRNFALDLERVGIASLAGKRYILRDTNYGMEIVSEEDLVSEMENYE